MAKVVTLASSASDLQGFIDALTQYAVPKYFNKIEAEEGDTGFAICYCDDEPVLKIPPGLRFPNYGTMIYVYANGSWVNITDSPSISASAVFKLIATENALLIVFRTDSRDSTLNTYVALPILIAKDINGNTAFYSQYRNINEVAGGTPVKVRTFSAGDTAIFYPGVSYNKTDSTTGMTGLIPIYTNGGYLADVWLPFITQFDPGIFSLVLDGKKFFQYESAVILDE